MDIPKVDSDGTHLYTPPSQLSHNCIHIYDRNPYHLLDGDHETEYERRYCESGEAPRWWWRNDNYAEKIGLGDDEDFYGFEDNDDVVSKDEKYYMDSLKNITGRGNDVSQLIVGEDWDKDLVKDDEDYTIPLVELIISSSWLTPLRMHLRGSRRCTSSYRPCHPLSQWK